MRPMLEVFQANSQANLSYVPQVYPNQITVFKTREQSGKMHQESTLGWSKLTEGSVEVHLLPGNHLTMLKKPHVQVVAKQLRECIEKVQSKSK